MSLRLVLLAASMGIAVSAPALSQGYLAGPIIEGEGAGNPTITGVVFEDADQDGARSEGEPGVAGVLVSNGLDWTRTDEDGRYEIAVREDFDLTIVQPSGWRVPTDARLVPQFSYTHKPGGTGYEMRYGGLPDTGPAPAQVHFPLTREGAAGEAFGCDRGRQPDLFEPGDQLAARRGGDRSGARPRDAGLPPLCGRRGRR